MEYNLPVNIKDESEVVLEKGKHHVVILKNQHFGTYNGYIGVNKDSCLYGIDYMDLDHMVDVHGGLTYAGRALLVEKEDEDDYWYFGFDTSHVGDYIPKLDKEIKHFLERISNILGIEIEEQENEYRDLEYVIKETSKLALDIKKIEELKMVV